MAIEIFEGVPGGGKSYFSVLRMVAHMSRGGHVYSNLQVKWDAVKAYAKRTRGLELKDGQFHHITDKRAVLDADGTPKMAFNQSTGAIEPVFVNEIQNFQRYTAGGTRELPTLIIIDEAHLYWGSRDWKATESNAREMLAFLTQHRKSHSDIIFITQHHRNLDASMSRLIQFRWTFRDLTKAKIMGIAWPWPTTLAVQYDYDGKTVVTRIFQKRKAEIFELYDSHSHFSEIKRLGQVDAVDTGYKQGKLARVPWKLIFICVGLPLLLFVCYRVFQTPASAHVPTAAAGASGAPKEEEKTKGSVSADDPPFQMSITPSGNSDVVLDLKATVDATPKMVLFPIDGFSSRGGVISFAATSSVYGRFGALSVGDIFPPYQILEFSFGSRQLPDIYAFDYNTEKLVILKPFYRPKQPIENSSNEFSNLRGGPSGGFVGGSGDTRSPSGVGNDSRQNARPRLNPAAASPDFPNQLPPLKLP